MKTYSETPQNGVFLDAEQRFSFPKDSPAHKRMLAEIAVGAATLVPYTPPSYAERRLDAYRLSGLTADGWTEALVEMVAQFGPHTAKFAELWAKREAIRSAIPKTNGT